MTNRYTGVLVCAALLTAGVVHAQAPSAPAEPGATPRTTCVIDDRLSVWLSLEAADRMIAALETERRELSAQLAQHGETLELMDEGKKVAEGVTLTRLGVLQTAETGSRETLRDAHDRVETRLDEVEETLRRRRLQRARLEERLEIHPGASATDES